MKNTTDLSFTHWRAYLLWATGQKKRFKIVCKSFGFTREEIIKIIQTKNQTR